MGLNHKGTNMTFFWFLPRCKPSSTLLGLSIKDNIKRFKNSYERIVNSPTLLSLSKYDNEERR